MELERHLEARAFALPARRPLRVGVELEVIPVHAATRAPVPPCLPDADPTRPWLDGLARERGWEPQVTPDGAPAYRLKGGGSVSYEPGGQIEYSSPPFASVDRLLADVEEVVGLLVGEGARHDVRLLARGVDPWNPPESAPLRLDGERYARMAAHLGRRGPAGHCMMCQTAAVHVNVDPGEPRAWRVANAMAPVLVATFANSRLYHGAATGFRSWRAEQWRRLDPARTGVIAPSARPVATYLEFALDAPAFLQGEPGREARPFREWLGTASLPDFERHLTTLFPEVRPRGYLELRGFDALPVRWLAAAVVLAVGVLQDATALAEAEALLPPTTGEALATAGRLGLSEPVVARTARDLFAVALEGARRLGGTVVGAAAFEAAERYFLEFTARGRDPGDTEDPFVDA